ncbi:MAG: glycosyltransferase WbuB, partial [Patescibacteria group bacterium]
MNILILHQYFLEKDGAGGSRFNQLAKYWSLAGHKVTVIAGTVDYATGQKNKKYKRKWITKEKIDKRITVLRCYVSKSYNKNFLGRLWAYLSFALSATWEGLFYVKRPKIIIASSPPLFVAIPGYLISRIKRKPLIFEIR